ncbi:hypothetical protein [Paenibacillus ginsengihumi]|uniref:hypothetical protein n=1 Tax=Paenibacillus ginsengihumi TaxID=431596 RepID=UPI0003A192FE|nr:hypothetical protein [Paenibacillus ginsengihumi]
MKASEARWGGGVSLLLFVFIFLPLLAVLLNVILPGLFFGQVQYGGFGLVGEIFHRPLWRQSFINSLTLAVGAATLGIVIAGILAAVRARWDFAAAKLLGPTVLRGRLDAGVHGYDRRFRPACRLGDGLQISDADVFDLFGDLSIAGSL